MTRQQALELLHTHIQNPNLRRHCYAVEAVMRSLAVRFGEDEDLWGLAGLLHDVDWEKTKDRPQDHVHTGISWLRQAGVDKRIIDAILAHGWKYVEGCPEPVGNMQWSLYCCDELTGLVVAVALIKGKSLGNVSKESVLKKFPEKSFAAGVNRDQIKFCEEKLGIKLDEFVAISLGAMQGIAKELGL